MSQTLQAVFWMIGTILSFSVMAVAGRELSGSLDTFEIMLYRSAVGVVIILICVMVLNRWSELPSQRLGRHFLRNLSHFTGQNLWFFAVGTIPLAQVFALEFTTPIWVILLSTVMLGEKLTLMRLICGALGFAGVLLVARPEGAELSPGVITAALAAIGFALSIILTKQLTQSESILCILFYLTVMQLFFGLIAAGYDLSITLPAPKEYGFVGAIALGGLFAHFCYTKALSLAPASVASPVDFARLPTIAIVAWLLYDEPLDLLIFIGAAIIFSGNYLNIWNETRKR